LKEYIDSVNKGIDFPSFSTDVGGPGMTVPKDSDEVVMDLSPGKYGIVCTIDNHLMAGMSKEFYVIKKENTVSVKPPKEDLTLILSDTGFSFTRPASYGNNLVKVINNGEQYHEVDFIKLNEGNTKEDYIKWINSRAGLPPCTAVGGTLDFISGNEVWLPLNLSKGNYVLSCLVPDVHTGKSHLNMGIIGEFTIK